MDTFDALHESLIKNNEEGHHMYQEYICMENDP